MLLRSMLRSVDFYFLISLPRNKRSFASGVNEQSFANRQI